MAKPDIVSSWVALPIAFGVATLVGVNLNLFVLRSLHLAVPVSALCSLAVLAVTQRRMRTVFPADPARAFVLALGASAIVPTLMFGLWAMHVADVRVQSTRRASDGYGALIVLVELAVALALPASIAAVEWAAARLRRPRLAAVLAPLALAAAALAVVGLARGASLPPPGSSPLRGFPIVATFRAPSQPDTTERHSLGPRTLAVRCVESMTTECHVLLLRGAPDPLPSGWPRATRQMPADSPTPYFVPLNEVIRVRRSERHDLWAVEQQEASGRVRTFAVFRGADLTSPDLTLSDFAGDFAPPLGWSVAALLGVVLALGIVRRARYAEPPLLVPTDAAVVDGLHYRGAAAVLDPIEMAARWREAQAALACSTLVLAGAPMAFAAWFRLLG